MILSHIISSLYAGSDVATRFIRYLWPLLSSLGPYVVHKRKLDNDDRTTVKKQYLAVALYSQPVSNVCYRETLTKI